MRALSFMCLLLGLSLSQFSFASSSLAREQLRVAVERWRSYARLCVDGNFPSKIHPDGRCDDGDSVLFNGLLCLSGETEACAGVRQAQDNVGQWWRSPRRVGGAEEGSNSFSRDMAIGSLAYLIASRDEAAASLWMQWLADHRKSESIKGIKTPTLTQFCQNGKDGTCVATPSFWSLAADIWHFLGIETNGHMRDPYKDLRLLSKFAKVLVDRLFGGLEGFSEFEIRSVPLGYQLHLKAVQVFLYQQIGLRKIYGGFDTQRSAQLIYERDPGNLFFAYLAQGSSESLIQKLLQICPVEGYDAPRYQWSWERDSKEEAWRESMGWDCVFLANLLLRDVE